MKFKYYIRGVGAGILFTVLIFSVAFHFYKKQNVVETPAYAVEDTQQAAGTIKESMNAQEPQNVPQKTIPETTNQAETQQPPQTDGPETESQISDLPENTEESDASEDYVQIQVYAGEVCRGVAEDLQKNGLVEDSEEFRLYMDKMGYDQFLHVGTYQIKKGATFEEIAKLLTN